MKMRLKTIAVFLILTLLALMAASCVTEIRATDLMKGIMPGAPDGKAADTVFMTNTADFSFRLLRQTVADRDNTLISPVSVILALAMTANGADRNTLAQMEQVLGGNISLADLNRYLYSYVQSLPDEEKARLHIANSIWLKDDNRLQVRQDFLQTNANYYGAMAYRTAFNDRTVKDINQWVRTNSDGMIEDIVDTLDPNTVMYLINAIAFQAEWDKPYKKADVRQGEFTGITGTKQKADFMHAEETTWLEDDRATGFVKPYSGRNYSFVALLPDKDITIEDYVASLSGQAFTDILNNAQNADVLTVLPKFTCDYKIMMNDALITLGMSDAFDPEKADFSRMASMSLFISRVIHKTFISVDELGTRAGAATSVEMAPTSAPVPLDRKEVILNRPFVYAIIDNETHLPLFLGILATL